MGDSIFVSLACRNAYGHVTGKVAYIEFARRAFPGDVTMSGETLDLTFQPTSICVGGQPFMFTRRRSFCGNLCHDEVTMEVGVARSLVHFLYGKGWQAEEWAITGPLADIVNTHEGERRVKSG